MRNAGLVANVGDSLRSYRKGNVSTRFTAVGILSQNEARRRLELGLCESSLLRLEYSVELRIEYSSTRLRPEVAINYIRWVKINGQLVTH